MSTDAIPGPRTPHHDTVPPSAGRFVDPDDLGCPGCGERPVRCAPPGYWKVSDGLPVSAFSHHDATALCSRADGTVADPVEAVSAERAGMA